ncbi:MAG: hypothetical protein FJW38_04655 [Acidobacteria bacterium]|nr:hypothetical protein [Acidobacteriota bacterium]
MPNPVVHQETYFFFPFVIDKEVVASAHGDFWPPLRSWIDGLDEWIRSENCATASPIRTKLGGWRRASYERFDLESPAYQDMVFFHPFVRRVFFDTKTGGQDTLIRVYEITAPEGGPVLWHAEDLRKRSCTVAVKDLRLFLFANGVGILSIGVERSDCSVREALWMNEMMRKVYPTSGRQRREGRIPSYSRLVHEGDILAEETFESGAIVQFQPPLSKLVQSLLYFLNYDANEYEQIFDERMIPYTYVTIARDFGEGEKIQMLLSRLLYVDRDGEGYRYDPAFTREQMKEHCYTRWAHEGTYYGFTRYSNVTLAYEQGTRGLHLASEGDLIQRMFQGRYYLMAIVALFYRVTLLDFAENVALVSRRLYHDLELGTLQHQNMGIATDLRSDFLNFCNYWHFDELANKDEEIEHFMMQCKAYRVEELRAQVEQEIEKMNAAINEYNQFRSTEAVNRLAMLSTIFGAGAVITGFFGMNFGSEFARYLFNPDGGTHHIHDAAVWSVSIIALTIVFLGVWLVATNWNDYRGILRLRGSRRYRLHRWFSLRSGGNH